MSTVVASVLVANVGVVPVSAFELTIHRIVVTQALDQKMDQQALGWVLGSTIDLPGTELPLWGTGNQGSDSIRNQYVPEHHFDNAPNPTMICQRWLDGLDTYLNKAVKLAAPGNDRATTLVDRKGALDLFGQATHAVEDFYAHTNWVELAIDAGASPSLAPITGKISPCEDGSLPDDLKSGFFRATAGPVIVAPKPDGSGKELIPTGCPYTGGEADTLDRTDLSDPDIVPLFSPLAATLFISAPATGTFMPPAKDGYEYCHIQLNKDAPDDPFMSPEGGKPAPGGWTYHLIAFELAIQATADLWQQLHDRLVDQSSVDPTLDADCLFHKLAWGGNDSCFSPKGQLVLCPSVTPRNAKEALQIQLWVFNGICPVRAPDGSLQPRRP